MTGMMLTRTESSFFFEKKMNVLAFGKKMNYEYDADKERIYFVLLRNKMNDEYDADKDRI